MPLEAKAEVSLAWSNPRALDLSTTTDSLLTDLTQRFTYGTGSGQVNAVFAHRYTRVTAGPANVDVSALHDAFGNAFAFAFIKVIAVRCVSSVTNGGVAVDFTFTDDNTQTLTLKAGNVSFLAASGAGMEVTGDTLQVSASDNTVYDIILMGIKV